MKMFRLCFSRARCSQADHICIRNDRDPSAAGNVFARGRHVLHGIMRCYAVSSHRSLQESLADAKVCATTSVCIKAPNEEI